MPSGIRRAQSEVTNNKITIREIREKNTRVESIHNRLMMCYSEYMDKIVIYCYHCIPTGKKYVGQTMHEERRKYHHRWLAIEKSSQQAFHRAIRKYGWDSFIYGVIEQTDDKNREAYWIEELNTMSEGYNMTTGGESNSHSQEVRERISAGNKGKVISQEQRMKISNSLKGRKLSDKQRERIREERNNRKTQPFEGKKHGKGFYDKVANTYEVEYTNGEIEIVKNMKQYCREKGYSESLMHKVKTGKRSRHKDVIRVTRI